MNESQELKEVRDFLTKKYTKLFVTRDNIWVPKGWLELVDTLLSDIKDKLIAQKITVAQIKEKFAGLRLYLDRETKGKLTPDDSADIYAMIWEAENESLNICQECGSKDEVTTNQTGTWKTLCQVCRGKEDLSKLKQHLDTVPNSSTIILPNNLPDKTK